MKAITAKRTFAGIAAFGAAALVLAGCAAAPEETAAPEQETEAATEEVVESVDFTACAGSGTGGWNDNSFNQSVLTGLEKAEAELGISVITAENQTIDDFEPNMQELLAADCDVIFAVSFDYSAALANASAENPEKNFVTIDGFVPADNVKIVGYAMEESSYLAGYLAAAYSESKIVGTWGGEQIEVLVPFMSGFYYGAKAWGEENGQDVTVIGWNPETGNGDFTGSWTDSSIAKTISLAQLEAGVDVMFPVAGGLFAAAAEAISETGSDAVILGVDADVALTSPQFADVVLTSVEKRMTNAVYDIISATLESGSFDASGYTGTLANGGTGLSSFYEFDAMVDDAVKARLAEIEAEIIAGTVVPLP